jgi:hypothetical protein
LEPQVRQIVRRTEHLPRERAGSTPRFNVTLDSDTFAAGGRHGPFQPRIFEVHR